MQNTLCYYGQNTDTTACGSNDFVGFTQWQRGCPTGRVCVAIDPDPNDNGTVSTTTTVRCRRRLLVRIRRTR